jgi:hypothetical protein
MRRADDCRIMWRTFFRHWSCIAMMLLFYICGCGCIRPGSLVVAEAKIILPARPVLMSSRTQSDHDRSLRLVSLATDNNGKLSSASVDDSFLGIERLLATKLEGKKFRLYAEAVLREVTLSTK